MCMCAVDRQTKVTMIVNQPLSRSDHREFRQAQRPGVHLIDNHSIQVHLVRHHGGWVERKQCSDVLVLTFLDFVCGGCDVLSTMLASALRLLFDSMITDRVGASVVMVLEEGKMVGRTFYR